MYTKEEIFDKLKEVLVNDFELDSDKVVLSANLFEDLELDSIDAVDLAVKIQQFTNKKISPNDFKEIKTLEDIVEKVRELVICK